MYSLKKFSCIFFLLFIISTGSAHSQVSLKELLHNVDNYAPALITDAANVRIRQLQADAANYNWLPSLKLNYQADIGTNNNLPGGYFSYGIVPGNSRVRTAGNDNTILTDLGIAAFDWEIYNFGAYSAQRKVAASNVRTEQARFGLSKYQLEATAVTYYLQLSRLQELLQVQAHNISRTEEIARSIRALTRSGVRAGVDTSIAIAELSKARLNYIELQNAFRQTQLMLSNISGMDTTMMVADTAYVMRLPELMLQSANTTADTETNPFLQPYELAYRNNLDQEQLVRKSYNPKISLDAAAWSRASSVTTTDEFRPLNTGLGFDRSNYLVGIGITYNVFDLKRKQLQLHVQQAATDLAQKQLDEQRRAIALHINSADAELETAQQRQSEIPQQLSAARAAYRQKLSLYRNGLTDILELDAALNVLYRAETDAITAKYLYSQALLKKAFATGKLTRLFDTL